MEHCWCLPGTATPSAPNEFAERAYRYACLDQHLAPYTRFFAAAALTNAVLADLCAHRARWVWISHTTVNALSSLGRLLESVNLHRAQRVDQTVRPSFLDASFIEMEQVIVELVLRGWSQNSARQYRQIIGELDMLVRATAAGLVPLRSASASLYGRVLMSLTRASGRYPSFALRHDRVKIGQALILEVRAVPAARAPGVSMSEPGRQSVKYRRFSSAPTFP